MFLEAKQTELDTTDFTSKSGPPIWK